MDRSQTRLLLALAALVMVVAALLYWQGEPGPTPPDPDATAEIWEVDPERVTAVRVERASGVLAIAKEGSGWQVVDPFRAPADDEMAHDLVDALRDLEQGVPVEAPPDRAADFGLGEPPNARVTLTLSEGGTMRLDVGTETPIGWRTYVRAADGTVAAVDGDPNRVLQADAQRFRDHRPLRFEAALVRRVTVRSPDGALTVRGQGLDWFFDAALADGAAFSGRADPDRVDDLVVGLQALRFDHVNDPSTPVDAPRFAVEVGLADGTTLGLEVGDETALGATVEASDGRTGSVGTGRLEELGRGPTDVAAPFAFGVRPDRADRVQLEGLVTLDARREGPDWKAEGGDPGGVADAVEGLARVPAVWRRDPPPPPDPVELRVTVTEGDREWTVEVGPAALGFRSARDTAGGAPFRLPESALDVALESLR